MLNDVSFNGTKNQVVPTILAARGEQQQVGLELVRTLASLFVERKRVFLALFNAVWKRKFVQQSGYFADIDFGFAAVVVGLQNDDLSIGLAA